MHPSIVGVPSYPIFVVAAALVGLGTSVVAAARSNVALERFVAATGILVFTMLVGAKMYSAGQQMLLGQPIVWGLSGGFRQPGTILAAFTLPIVVRRLLPGVGVGRVADLYVLPIAAGLSVFRIGCLLRGCCHGGITALPIGLSFPAGSPAWKWQVATRQLWGYEDFALPVHPLQLYLATCVWVSALAAVLGRRMGLWRPGLSFLVFIALAESGKGALESLRVEGLTGSNPVQVADGTMALAAVVALLIIWLKTRWPTSGSGTSRRGIPSTSPW